MFGYPFTSFPAAPVNLTLSSQHSYLAGVWWQGISTSFYRNEWEKIKQTKSGGIAPLKIKNKCPVKFMHFQHWSWLS